MADAAAEPGRIEIRAPCDASLSLAVVPFCAVPLVEMPAMHLGVPLQKFLEIHSIMVRLGVRAKLSVIDDGLKAHFLRGKTRELMSNVFSHDQKIVAIARESQSSEQMMKQEWVIPDDKTKFGPDLITLHGLVRLFQKRVAQ
eukprot:g20649.t1